MHMMLPIPEYNYLYAATIDGRIFRLAGGKGSVAGKEIRQIVNDRGYCVVCLRKDGETKSCRVHRLVASTFIENPNGLPEVNHIDGDKKNNNATNLEWCTRSRNAHHAHSTGLATSTRLPSRCVVGTNIKTGAVISYRSIGDARRDGFHDSSISACCKGKRSKHAGYRWAYDD